jgi:outer membrane protein assembly factor BamB
MTTGSPDRAARASLRIWPGVVIVALLWFFRFGLMAVWPGTIMVSMMGAAVWTLGFLVWWLFFSRAPWSDRWGGLILAAAALAATPLLLHKSFGSPLFHMYAVPFVCLALVAALAVTRRSSADVRRAAMASGILLACGAWTFVRTEGVTGDFQNDFRWRWSGTAEERLLATARAAGETPPLMNEADAGAAGGAAEWPGFRGPARDGVVRGARIGTDWSASPPVELWRRPVGPGWSSFAVHGDLACTQEQRGEQEVVACYSVSTGRPVWAHSDPARFYETAGGPGPRGTPTYHEGRIYTLGATGVLNALDATDGSVVWSRNAAADTGRKVPEWGFAASPLVMDDVLVVATAGQMAGYDLAGGEPRWVGPTGGGSYSSPHPATFDGVAQVLLMSGFGATSVAPGDGAVLWRKELAPSQRIVQPAVTTDGDLLVGDGQMDGMRRLHVARVSSGWRVEERWATTGLKPHFNDFVVHDGHAFGFDGSLLSCIDLASGERRWKGGRYGHGQMVLLADQALLLVMAEQGDLALVRADPRAFTELAHIPALHGKSWNHPVLAGDILLVRNGEEIAAFRMPAEARVP